MEIRDRPHLLACLLPVILRNAGRKIVFAFLTFLFDRQIAEMLTRLEDLFRAWQAGELPPPAQPLRRRSNHTRNPRPESVRRPKARPCVPTIPPHQSGRPRSIPRRRTPTPKFEARENHALFVPIY